MAVYGSSNETVHFVGRELKLDQIMATYDDATWAGGITNTCECPQVGILLVLYVDAKNKIASGQLSKMFAVIIDFHSKLNKDLMNTRRAAAWEQVSKVSMLEGKLDALRKMRVFRTPGKAIKSVLPCMAMCSTSLGECMLHSK